MSANPSTKKAFAGVFLLWHKHWKIYGGLGALLGSTYFLFSIIITAINYWSWSKPEWWEIVLSTIPDILGFTLAGLAVFLSMDAGFSKIITGQRKNSKASPFMTLVSSFVHFITVQTLAFIYALTAKSLYVSVDGLPNWYYQALPILNLIGGALGYFLFIYAMLLILGATFAIFRYSTWYEKYIETIKATERQSD